MYVDVLLYNLFVNVSICVSNEQIDENFAYLYINIKCNLVYL